MNDRSEKEIKRFTLTSKNVVIFSVVFLLFVLASALAFFFGYRSYSDQILYQERLNQMQEVTGQLFHGLEDVIDNQWYHAGVQTNRLLIDNPSTTDELLRFLDEQATLTNLNTIGSELIVVNDKGRYYSQKGQNGFISETEYVDGRYERISFVLSSTTQDVTKMYFLEKLKTPIVIDADSQEPIELTYCGLARDMKELNSYFTCDAYHGKNAIYVLDDLGTMLFSGNNSSEYLKGFNAFKQLEDSTYLHGSSFESVKKEMDEKGVSYSNAMIDSTECYYSLYQMANTEWILLFVVPSNVVATNTVSLVNSSVMIVLIYALIMLVVSAFFIYFFVHSQQKRAVLASEENNRKLEKANEELRLAEQRTKVALKAAESANKAKTEFLSNMSHDIRTPMNAIVGLTKLMEHDVGDAEQMKIYFRKMENSSQHLLSLINDVLDMSKIEASEVTLNQEPVNLAEQVGEVDSILRPQAKERHQTFLITVHEIIHENLIGDALRFRQILINLLSNAIKYTPDGGKIQLIFSEKPGKDLDHEILEIDVKDNGVGMSPEFLKKVFDPFTRAENSITNKVQGTGLGMAITKNIVRLMGGTITVESEVGKGTCFHVSIPLEIDRKYQLNLDLDKVLLVAEDENLIQNAKACFSLCTTKLDVVRTREDLDWYLNANTVDSVLLSGYIQSPELPEMVTLLHQKAKNAILVFCVDYTQQQLTSEFLKKTGLSGLISRPFFLTNFAHFVAQLKLEHRNKESNQKNGLQGKKFLCAEDNALNAEILKALLDMSGATCKVYENGQELLDAFHDVKLGEYDAILMDVQMPVMDGLEATREIRHSKNPLGKKIPIIAMTANAFSSDIKDCLDAGMDAHLAKPLEVSQLERVLKNIESAGGGQILEE